MDFQSFVLVAATADLGDEPNARNHADALEFRLDGANDPIDALEAYDGALPVIATNRPVSEGGTVADGPERIATLQRAITFSKVEVVDVELATVEDGEANRLLNTARDHNVKAIVSTHDFESTPSIDRLRALLERASEAGDVAKLAVTASSPGDVLDLLRATWSATKSGETVATMAMGESGMHSRAIAPIYGSKIGYAPIDSERATAPGQYDLATLHDLVAQLRGPMAGAED